MIPDKAASSTGFSPARGLEVHFGVRSTRKDLLLQRSSEMTFHQSRGEGRQRLIEFFSFHSFAFQVKLTSEKGQGFWKVRRPWRQKFQGSQRLCGEGSLQPGSPGWGEPAPSSLFVLSCYVLPSASHSSLLSGNMRCGLGEILGMKYLGRTNALVFLVGISLPSIIT